jgi:hypothetical protein
MNVAIRGSSPFGDKRDVCRSPNAMQIAPTIFPN